MWKLPSACGIALWEKACCSTRNGWSSWNDHSSPEQSPSVNEGSLRRCSLYRIATLQPGRSSLHVDIGLGTTQASLFADVFEGQRAPLCFSLLSGSELADPRFLVTDMVAIIIGELYSLLFTALVGLVVKASASKVEDPGFESGLRRDFSGVESYQ